MSPLAGLAARGVTCWMGNSGGSLCYLCLARTIGNIGLFRFRPNCMLQQKRAALVGEVFEADSCAWASAGGQVFRQAPDEVFRGGELSGVGLHLGGDLGVVSLRERTELAPIEPRRGDRPDISEIA